MRHTIRIIQIACVVGFGILAGCASLLPPSPLAPLFITNSADAKLIEALAHEQYTRVEQCHERKSCPQENYTRALIALFQSRERALAAFQQVQAVAPNSRLAVSSASWMNLLQANSGSLSSLNIQNAGWAPVMEDFVWEVLERELADANDNVRHVFNDRAKRVGNMTNRPALTKHDRMTIPRDTDQKPTARETDPETVQALQRQLQERERMLAERDYRLAVMSNQLNDLKRIDQDSQERRRSVRPSATITP
jgi:hypothetical protein